MKLNPAFIPWVLMCMGIGYLITGTISGAIAGLVVSCALSLLADGRS